MRISLSDVYNFLSKMTLQRIANVCALVSSYYIAKWTGYNLHWGKPMTVSIEPTTACNLHCPECPSGLRNFSRSTGNLKKDFFTKSIDQLADRLIYLIFYFQGEPYINPDFLDMVHYAHSKKIYTISSTNGHFLTDRLAEKTVRSGLDRLIISVDGTTQEVYEQYRKEGNLENVLQGARNIIRWKKKLGSNTPHTIFQFLVVRPNEHQIDELYRLANEIGIDEVKLKTAQVYDYKNGNPLIPTLDKYSRYRKLKDGTYELKNKLANHCWKLWHGCVITWDGYVIPCCFDKDATHRFGSLKDQSFDEIWEGDRYRTFREKILVGRDRIDICKNCSEGGKVWI